NLTDPKPLNFSGGRAHKRASLSLTLWPVKRVQSSPNLYAAAGSDSQSSDSDAWRSRSVSEGLRNGDASSSSLTSKGFRSVRPNLQDKKSPTLGQMAMNGSSQSQRPFSPPVYPPPPPTLSPGLGSETVKKETVVSGETVVSSSVPIARFSEEEKKVSVIKAPHYEGIGPVDESGIPIAIRTVSDIQAFLRELTKMTEIKNNYKNDFSYAVNYMSCYTCKQTTTDKKCRLA
uniref:SoHo domain-containing protein n=1 Tax=Sinocyclocheilus rhinocerous TaxID=307959 RepID=A0A673IDL6_9TELE